MNRRASAIVHTAAVLLVSASVGLAAAQDVKAPKKPRVRPQQVITVKVYPAEHFAAKAKAGELYLLTTVSDFTCTAWVPAGATLDDELRAYRACATELNRRNAVP